LTSWTTALERLREAEILAERLNDDPRRGRVCAFMTTVHAGLGELNEAVVTGTRALEIAGRLGDLRVRILATSYLEQAYYLRGEYEKTAALATDNLAVLPADWVYESFGNAAPASVYDCGWLILSLAELAAFGEAADHEAEVIRLAAPTKHAFTVGWAHLTAGRVHLLREDWSKARARFEHATGVLRAANVTILVSTLVAASACVLAQLGEATEALSRLREGELRLSGTNPGLSYHWLGRAALVLSRLDDAQRLGDRAVKTSQSQPGYTAYALHLLGDVAIHPDRFDAERGEAHYRQALTLAEPRAMRPLVAHCHLGLGRLYLRAGKPKASPRQPHDRGDDVPRDGHDVLAGTGRMESNDLV
jgi:tetratricopeptide (TPR) repeat protein